MPKQAGKLHPQYPVSLTAQHKYITLGDTFLHFVTLAETFAVTQIVGLEYLSFANRDQLVPSTITNFETSLHLTRYPQLQTQAQRAHSITYIPTNTP